MELFFRVITFHGVIYVEEFLHGSSWEHILPPLGVVLILAFSSVSFRKLRNRLTHVPTTIWPRFPPWWGMNVAMTEETTLPDSA